MSKTGQISGQKIENPSSENHFFFNFQIVFKSFFFSRRIKNCLRRKVNKKGILFYRKREKEMISRAKCLRNGFENKFFCGGTISPVLIKHVMVTTWLTSCVLELNEGGEVTGLDPSFFFLVERCRGWAFVVRCKRKSDLLSWFIRLGNYRILRLKTCAKHKHVK